MEILSLKIDGFGMDISDLSLKIVKLKKKRGAFKLACFGETKINPTKKINKLNDRVKKLKTKKLW